MLLATQQLVEKRKKFSLVVLPASASRAGFVVGFCCGERQGFAFEATDTRKSW